ncbi:MAG TPA: AMP-binding protein [Thermoanaerobaculia bacterium]|jgi:amino acid adenylation domain-containing protein
MAKDATIPWMLDRTLAAHGEREGLFAATGSLTFAELYRRALATAEVLRETGVRPGDRVGILMEKSLEQVVAILGSLFAQAVFVPLHPTLKRDNVDHVIADCGMAAMIADAGRVPELAGGHPALKLLVGRGEEREGLPSLPRLLAAAGSPRRFFAGAGDDAAAIIYSSGSTGRPKGIVISHRNLADGARIVASYLNTTSEDRIAFLLTFNFDYGLNQLWQTLYTGASLYLHDFLFPRDGFELLAAKRITALPLMPVLISRLFDERFPARGREWDFSALRYVCSTGGRVWPKMLDHLRGRFPQAEIYLMYGLTEAFRSSYLPPSELARRPTSIGKAIPEVELHVLDEQGEICPPHVPGELVHRGGCIAKGYWNNPQATAERFREIPRFPGERVVFSGDIVKTDEEGFLYYVSRKDAMIKSQGFRISPTEVEEIAVQQAGVSAAVAFGVLSEAAGEDVVLVYTGPEGAVPGEPDLLAALNRALPFYMVPKRVLRMEEFPATGGGGKIDRVTVRREALRRLGLGAPA